MYSKPKYDWSFLRQDQILPNLLNPRSPTIKPISLTQPPLKPYQYLKRISSKA